MSARTYQGPRTTAKRCPLSVARWCALTSTLRPVESMNSSSRRSTVPPVPPAICADRVPVPARGSTPGQALRGPQSPRPGHVPAPRRQSSPSAPGSRLSICDTRCPAHLHGGHDCSSERAQDVPWGTTHECSAPGLGRSLRPGKSPKEVVAVKDGGDEDDCRGRVTAAASSVRWPGLRGPFSLVGAHCRSDSVGPGLFSSVAPSVPWAAGHRSWCCRPLVDQRPIFSGRGPAEDPLALLCDSRGWAREQPNSL